MVSKLFRILSSIGKKVKTKTITFILAIIKYFIPYPFRSVTPTLTP